MKHGSTFTIMLAMTMLVMFVGPGCDDSGPVSSNPHQPFIPADPTPTNGLDSESLIMPLSWCGGDPDGDPVVYDVYLGTTRLPELVAAGLTDNSFTTDFLKADETYFWRVVARDPDGNSISSPLWTFRTAGGEGDFVFPSTIGNRWSYRAGYYYCNPTMEVLPEGLSLDTFSTNQQSEVVSLDTLTDGREAYRITSTFDRPEQLRGGRYTYQESSWYRDEADGHYIVANSSSRYWPQPHEWFVRWPAIAPAKETLDLGQSYAEDDYYLIDPPRKEIAYPLETGKSWVYTVSPFARILKRCTGRATIQVPTGTFDCWEIRWVYRSHVSDEPEQIEMIDYVADIGIVARFMRVNGLLWTGYDFPDASSGYVDYVEYYELEEYDVK